MLVSSERLLYNGNANTRSAKEEELHMKRQEEYKSCIVEMLDKLDSSDETFLKQLIILIKKHLERKRGR